MHPGVIIASSLALLFGLAIVAVLVSQQSQTSNVISSAGTALSNVIKAAVSPVTTSNGLLSNSTGTLI